MSNFTTTVCNRCSQQFEHILSPTRPLLTCPDCVRREMGIGRFRKQDVETSVRATVGVKVDVKVSKPKPVEPETVNIPSEITRKLGSLTTRYGDIKKLTSRMNHRRDGQ